ncbi:MAG: ATPase [Acidiphilium sp. 37-67-22]|nr:MAG: ATPase [Acidiphilium sp. 37-67-22]HQT72793.1 ATP12 family protein [Acidiphilium sp.]
MKRIWKCTGLAEMEGGFGVTLDGRPVRLPGGSPLAVPTERLARAIAAEWDAPGENDEVRPDDLPLTRLAGTTVERIAPDTGAVRASLLAYGRSDLLCYRATAPEGLVAEQARLWQPWLDWAQSTLGTHLAVTAGITAIDQPAEAIGALDQALARHDAWSLAGLGVTVPALGSLVLGLAIAEGALAPLAAHDCAALDELWQERLWGEDAEAVARRARIGDDIVTAARFVTLAQR